MPSRFGAVSAIVGAIILLVGSTLHPLGADPGDPVAAFTEYAADDPWVFSHLGQFFGVAMMFVGLVALSDTLDGGRRVWLSRLGIYVGVAALAATAVLQAVDGVALKFMVDAWAGAPGEQKLSAFHAALAVRQIEVGVASFTALLFGAVFTLFGLAVAQDDRYPSWLGWLGFLGGIGTVAGGLLIVTSGFSTTAMSIAMPFNLILVIWMIAIGVHMWRHA